MTARDTPAPEPVQSLLDEAGLSHDQRLDDVLQSIRDLGTGPEPECSAELAQLMSDGGRPGQSRRHKRRITFIGGALAVSMGVGMSGVAAGTLHLPGHTGESFDATARFSVRDSADRLEAGGHVRTGPDPLTDAGTTPVPTAERPSGAGSPVPGDSGGSSTTAVHAVPVAPLPPLPQGPGQARTASDAGSVPAAPLPQGTGEARTAPDAGSLPAVPLPPTTGEVGSPARSSAPGPADARSGVSSVAPTRAGEDAASDVAAAAETAAHRSVTVPAVSGPAEGPTTTTRLASSPVPGQRRETGDARPVAPSGDARVDGALLRDRFSATSPTTGGSPVMSTLWLRAAAPQPEDTSTLSYPVLTDSDLGGLFPVEAGVYGPDPADVPGGSIEPADPQDAKPAPSPVPTGGDPAPGVGPSAVPEVDQGAPPEQVAAAGAGTGAEVAADAEAVADVTVGGDGGTGATPPEETLQEIPDEAPKTLQGGPSPSDG
ncbi:hypothetical protein FJV46_09420 [Arthrobacter agilis]|uniref:hypothetical protein n=1 Tax=Arthrobacter agilis TaxID=37921 RepID=UPI000B3641D5|nr:hypothetical protein [Arthrobacter agilis]OUM43646.1 hypothetical protein B8W74_05665 [Arthrobacter agilis]PPB46768.1 hypothetical protein CI784_05725 [Arthrobacter agilis]TPV24891.1 hypothetical protein FJV46_09420 [Arthrobacter agilis]VDR31053.1 Uncharacterised protein [Arthrobacter agilis]